MSTDCFTLPCAGVRDDNIHHLGLFSTVYCFVNDFRSLFPAISFDSFSESSVPFSSEYPRLFDRLMQYAIKVADNVAYAATAIAIVNIKV